MGQNSIQEDSGLHGRKTQIDGGRIGAAGRQCSNIRQMRSRMPHRRGLRSDRVLRTNYSHYSGKRQIRTLEIGYG